ncbi:MAG: PTS system mannose/fructose/N-acetylgalactosamine-transporter subunit IIB [Bacillota bacterium]
MGEIVLTRIDDRLIHGQVMTSWLNYTSANRITIIDELTAKDPFMRNILEMVIPPGIKLDICDIDTGADTLINQLKEKDKVIVLAKGPEAILELLEKGVNIKNLNVGGMGAKPGRKKFYKNISASEEEKEIFRKILAKGVEISVQIIAEDSKTNVEKFL